MHKLFLFGYGKLGHLVEEVLLLDGIRIDGIYDTSSTPLPRSEHEEAALINCISTVPTKLVMELGGEKGWKTIIPAWDIIQHRSGGISNGWFLDFTGYSGHNVAMTQEIGTRWTDGWSWWHYTAFLTWHEKRVEMCPMSWAPIDCSNRWEIPEIVAAVKKKINRTASWHLSQPEGSDLASIQARRKVVDLSNIDPHLWRYVKLHCEGKELESLRVNMELFVKHRPIIAVTCYHNEDGAWQIEKMLMDWLADYNFHFRLHAYMGTGAVMYCIPKEVA